MVNIKKVLAYNKLRVSKFNRHNINFFSNINICALL